MQEQVPDKAAGLTRVWRAFLYTRDGLRATFKSEAAFRQEVLLVAVLAPLAFFIAPDRASLALMVGSLFLVLIVELLNSAIESIVNRIGPEWNVLSKNAKDAGSAAVFLSLVGAGLVWIICLL
jgi:diacylglycerol kinase (ATP)